jgi:hypothetical protein
VIANNKSKGNKDAGQKAPGSVAIRQSDSNLSTHPTSLEIQPESGSLVIGFRQLSKPRKKDRTGKHESA